MFGGGFVEGGGAGVGEWFGLGFGVRSLWHDGVVRQIPVLEALMVAVLAGILRY